ncbi:Uu.00g147000.m01.CDS01 [Anthostomella pinea]|uniref:Uu.00g147000.m01.CDS01 n=1 Tax=Anthostomella pinea TaxID=933095 RepID=A0AAI8VS62_9PEZI|nr:Uu.00g147000.m01.CDS01 [Anthostomella pinea]
MSSSDARVHCDVVCNVSSAQPTSPATADTLTAENMQPAVAPSHQTSDDQLGVCEPDTTSDTQEPTKVQMTTDSAEHDAVNEPDLKELDAIEDHAMPNTVDSNPLAKHIIGSPTTPTTQAGESIVPETTVNATAAATEENKNDVHDEQILTTSDDKPKDINSIRMSTNMSTKGGQPEMSGPSYAPNMPIAKVNESEIHESSEISTAPAIAVEEPETHETTEVQAVVSESQLVVDKSVDMTATPDSQGSPETHEVAGDLVLTKTDNLLTDSATNTPSPASAHEDKPSADESTGSQKLTTEAMSNSYESTGQEKSGWDEVVTTDDKQEIQSSTATNVSPAKKQNADVIASTRDTWDHADKSGAAPGSISAQQLRAASLAAPINQPRNISVSGPTTKPQKPLSPTAPVFTSQYKKPAAGARVTERFEGARLIVDQEEFQRDCKRWGLKGLSASRWNK